MGDRGMAREMFDTGVLTEDTESTEMDDGVVLVRLVSEDGEAQWGQEGIWREGFGGG